MKKIFLLCFLLNLNIFANTETISLDFELSRTAINRAIVSQFNDPNFVFHHFTGQFEFLPGQTVPYDITLARPTVEIDENSIGIHLAFSVSLPSLGYNYELDITPDITINEASIKASEVVAFIEELEQSINNCQGIPQSVKDLIVDLYETYEPHVYSSSLYNEAIEEINSNDFVAQRAINITEFRLNVNTEANKLLLEILVDLDASTTEFVTQIIKDDDGNNESILIDSKIKSMVKRIEIWDEAGNSLYSNEWNDENLLELQISQPTYAWYGAKVNVGNITNNPLGILVWHVYFKTDATFYYNMYKKQPDAYAYPYKRINY